MVNLLTGPKGTGKTQIMIEKANEAAKNCNGNVVFIKKTHRDTTSVDFNIRTICMDDLPAIKKHRQLHWIFIWNVQFQPRY